MTSLHVLQQQRRDLERRRRVIDHEITIPGALRPYTIAVPEDPEAVLDELAETDPQAQHMPYWATLWPSGLALAEYILVRPETVIGKRVVELGCGLGVTATAAVDAGADVIIADCFAEALAFARYNSKRNTGHEPAACLADWRTTAGQRTLEDEGPFSLVLAADVLYEREDIVPLLQLIAQLLVPEGTFLLAEPGRATSEQFLADAQAAGWTGPMIEFKRDWPAGAGHARVRIHALRQEPMPPE